MGNFKKNLRKFYQKHRWKKLSIRFVMGIFLFLVFILNGYSQSSPSKKLIKKSRMESNLAIKNHDLEKIISFWHSDIIITTGNGKILDGQEAILKILKNSFEANKNLYYVRKSKRIKVNEAAGLAWESGSWKSFGSNVIYQGRYAAMWERVGGEWKIKSQLFVSLPK